MTSSRANQIRRLRRSLAAAAAALFAGTFGLVAQHAKASGSETSQTPAQVQQSSGDDGFFDGSDDYSLGSTQSSSSSAAQSRVS